MYEHISQDVNAQRCVNMFPTTAGPEGRGKAVLLPTAGLRSMGTAAETEVRAIIRFDDSVYAVIGPTFYKVTVNTAAKTVSLSSLGTLNTGTGKVSWARNPTQIMLVDGSTSGYIHTVSTDIFATISDADFIGGTTVVFMDSYFIYNAPGTALMYATAINDGTSVDALDVVTAEAAPDDLVGLAVDKRELWAFGKHSVEIWYDAANSTGFPFSRRDGAHIDVGCAAAGSILNFDNSLMWLDERGYVVRAEGYAPSIVSTDPINKEIGSYTDISDAIAYQHVDRGHLFYVISFPSAEKTWAYDAVTQAWHERAYFNQDNDFERDRVSCCTKYNQLYLAGSRNSGDIYLVDSDYYLHGSDPIHRLRVTQHQNAEFLQIGVNELELHMQSGTALVTGTGSDPQIMMRYSNDGGYTWSYEQARSIGKLGEYNKTIRWNRLGTAREWLLEFRITDPIDFALISASADVTLGNT